ncbi:MAG: polysaccharide deacetylase family protein [Clostridia bacterium]|nr:polysaccharide deacetylase family protein [Clostridia bacterium]
MKRLFERSAAAVLIAAALLTSCAMPGLEKESVPEEKLTTVSFPLSAPVPEKPEEEKREEIVIPHVDAGAPMGQVWIDGEAVGEGYYLIGGRKFVALSAVTEETGFSEALGGFFKDGRLYSAALCDEEKGYMAPLELLTERKEYASMELGDDLYFTTTVKSGEVPTGKRVPVLMYHAVSDDTWGIKELFVKPSEMEKQLKYLTEHGYTTITFEDIPDLESIKKPVMLTFDDGYKDNYEELFPLLKKYNCKATIFMIAGKEGKTHYLTADMITEMSESGLVSIQSHTMTHPKLGELSAEKQRAELEEARKTIAGWTHRIPFVLCYPSGSYNNSTREIGKEYYSFGIRMNGGLWNTSGDPFLVPRYYVSRETSLSAFAGMIG